VRVRLNGVASATKILASGEKRTYYYAWRGGPQLYGEPGSPEFVESYHEARRRDPNPSLFKSIITGYLTSPEFSEIRDRTKRDYVKQIAKIENAFGDLPLEALADPLVTKVFLDWRNGMKASPRQADYAWAVLMLLMSWGRTQGLISYRPPGRVKRLYKGDRADKIWQDDHIVAFMRAAPVRLQWALVLATETGQRQGDLLKLPWSAYDGDWITLTQSKSNRKVKVPVSVRLKAMLAIVPKVGPVILTNARGRPWTANGFRAPWRHASRNAGILDLHFHDLRGTAVTRLSEAECTPQQIARFTGHALRDVGTILDRYLARTDTLALTALAKLERSRK
jgi:integrase